MPYYPTTAQLRKIRIATYGPGLRGWWKQGWNEYPELMFAAAHLFFGLGVGAWKLKKHLDFGTDIKETRSEYTVYRSDDERLKEYIKYYKANGKLNTS